MIIILKIQPDARPRIFNLVKWTAEHELIVRDETNFLSIKHFAETSGIRKVWETIATYENIVKEYGKYGIRTNIGCCKIKNVCDRCYISAPFGCNSKMQTIQFIIFCFSFTYIHIFMYTYILSNETHIKFCILSLHFPFLLAFSSSSLKRNYAIYKFIHEKKNEHTLCI